MHPDWTGSEPLKLRVSDFEMLAKAGAFEGRYKVELIEGLIVAMNAEYRLHGVVKNRLVYRLQRALEGLGSDLEAVAEVSVKLDDNSLPQPDAMVVRVVLDRGYFGPTDLRIAIEVSDSSLRKDLTKKSDLYAASSIPELWVADLRSAELHQFWNPVSGKYQEKRTTFLLGTIQSVTIPDLKIDGAGIV